jgi:DNA polymerase-3 subunit delta
VAIAAPDNPMAFSLVSRLEDRIGRADGRALPLSYRIETSESALALSDTDDYFKRPDAEGAGCLIYGEDAVRVGQLRAGLVSALLGPGADEEMRLTRLSAAELRSDGALLLDAVKAVGFFPGPRAVQVDQATDGLSAVLEATLSDWQKGDAQIIVTAGVLAKRSSLRKLFEGSKTAYVAAVYADPPGRGEIEDLLKSVGLGNVDRAAMVDLETLARTLSAGDFRQTHRQARPLQTRRRRPRFAHRTSRPSPPSAERRSLTTSCTPRPRPHRDPSARSCRG